MRISDWSSDVCSSDLIQPHLPIRLPCYDFTPVMDHSVGVVLLAVRLTPSGATHSHGVTGGVYKARERIHRGIADRKSVVSGKSVSVRVDLGGRRIIKKNKNIRYR